MQNYESSPATRAFELERNLSSCIAENAALHEKVMRLTLTAGEREAIQFFLEAGKFWSQNDGQRHLSVLRYLLKRTAE